MTERDEERPWWIVLTPVPLDVVARHVATRWPLDEEEMMPEEMDAWPRARAGRGQYSGVWDAEPYNSQSGGEEDLARALSRELAGPTYVIWHTREGVMPRTWSVRAFEGGEERGEVFVDPDRLAVHLGCPYPGCGSMDLRPDDDLVAHPYPLATEGDPTIGPSTIAQWRHVMRRVDDWTLYLDELGRDGVDDALSLLAASDPDARIIAARILSRLNSSLLGERFDDVLARLERLALTEPDARVRESVAEDAAILAEWRA